MAGKLASAFLDTFDRAGFLVPVTWTPAGGGPSAGFNARFEAGGSAVLGGMMTAVEPAITFKTSSAAALTNGDGVVVSALNYKVRDVVPLYDGTITRAALRKAA